MSERRSSFHRISPAVLFSFVGGGTTGDSWTACNGNYLKVTRGNVAATFLDGGYDTGNCSQYSSYVDPCYTVSGGYSLSMTRLDADVNLTPPQVSIHPGGSATFQWAAAPAVLASGDSTPLTLVRTFFQPDSESKGGVAADSTKTCSMLTSNKSCAISPTGSRTLHLWFMVNGKLVHQTAPVLVATLALVASPNWVESFPAKDSVTFTPRWSDGLAISDADVIGYRWDADAPPGRTAGCSPAARCKTAVLEAGWMTVTVTSNGQTRTARAHVGITPCPMGDPILDDSVVVAGMSQLWNDSNPDDSVTSNRREEIGWVVRDPRTGRDSLIEDLNPMGNTPCTSKSYIPKIPEGDSVIAHVHTHPFTHGDILPSNCEHPGWAYDAVRYGGPSGPDWGQIDTPRAYASDGTGYNIPEYVIDNVNVYRGDPGTPEDQRKNAPRFKRQSTSCNLF